MDLIERVTSENLDYPDLDVIPDFDDAPESCFVGRETTENLYKPEFDIILDFKMAQNMFCTT